MVPLYYFPLSIRLNKRYSRDIFSIFDLKLRGFSATLGVLRPAVTFAEVVVIEEVVACNSAHALTKVVSHFSPRVTKYINDS